MSFYDNFNFRKYLLIVSILFLSLNSVYSQSESGRLAFGFDAGINKYWGDFTDNQFWLNGDLFLRYNIIPEISIMGSVGITQIRYKIDNISLANNPDYFGVGKNVGDMYPNSNIKINGKNAVRVNTYEGYLTYNLFPHERFVPYVFGGVGYMNWEPQSGDTGFDGPLPNNANAVYAKNKIIIPAGVGFEAYLSDNFIFNGRATFRFTGTDYLDDYAATGTEKDAFLTVGFGVSYYILGDADLDKDGLTNDRERALGTDPNNPDTDGEGLKDGEEVNGYKTNPLKADTDEDGLNDYVEVNQYNTNPLNVDSDSDGLKDGDEVARKTDPRISDTDGDKLIDGDEVNKHQTDPLNSDTDNDGLSDGDEINKYNTNPKSSDSDNDGLTDGKEVNEYSTNPALPDTDADGLKDGLEVNQYRTNPTKPDTDEDGLIDGEEVEKYATDPMKVDSDGDGLSDGDEVKKFKTNPLLADSDKDRLNDGDELNTYKTDPIDTDSDKDALKDGDEVLTYKTDPMKIDSDGDGLTDGDEVNKHKTNPMLTDTDKDKLSDGDEVNRVHTNPLNPDTDKDGVIDGEDDCPLVAGEKSSSKGRNGCPAAPKVGTKVDFPDILFIVNTDQFNFEIPSTAASLATVLAYVNQCDGIQVIIEGHASEEGSKARNQELSDMRAKKVKEWLIEQGAKPEKIANTIGYGSSQPKYKEPTGAALKKIKPAELEGIRKQNRRITSKVVKTCS